VKEEFKPEIEKFMSPAMEGNVQSCQLSFPIQLKAFKVEDRKQLIWPIAITGKSSVHPHS
jgi:hypothetical protein